MEGQTMLGRGIAGVGVVLGLIAIWVGAASNGAVSTKYWDDGTYGGVLLILAILAALALAAAIATDRRDYDLAYGAIGGIGFGLYLFVPAVFAFDQWKLLDTGAWLGLCSALTFIGATIATWDSDRPLARPPAAGALLAFAGLALVFAGIFPTYESGQGSYWDINGNGHSFAITLIILIVLTALSIGAAYSMAAGMDSAILLGAITFGAALAVPVNNAFNNFGDLEAGAWLTAIGGILVAVGVAVMWQMRSEEVPTPAPSPPAA